MINSITKHNQSKEKLLKVAEKFLFDGSDSKSLSVDVKVDTNIGRLNIYTKNFLMTTLEDESLVYFFLRLNRLIGNWIDFWPKMPNICWKEHRSNFIHCYLNGKHFLYLTVNFGYGKRIHTTKMNSALSGGHYPLSTYIKHREELWYKIKAQCNLNRLK